MKHWLLHSPVASVMEAFFVLISVAWYLADCPKLAFCYMAYVVFSLVLDKAKK